MTRLRLLLASAMLLAGLAVPALLASPASARSCSIPFSHGTHWAQIYTASPCGRYWRVSGSFSDGLRVNGSWRTSTGKYSVAYDAGGRLRLAWKQWKYCSGCHVYSALMYG